MSSTGHDAGPDGSSATKDGGDRDPRQVSELSLDFTTRSYDGRYATHNAGAVWIEDIEGRWLFTLELWISTTFFSGLERYRQAGGPNYTTFLATSNAPPDVITSATRGDHESHHLEWDLLAEDDTPIANGRYVIVIELTEGPPNQVYELPFEITNQPSMLTGPEAPSFTDVQLSLK